MKHIVALSGGKDSTCMAVALQEREPHDYEYAITPTGNELPEMYLHWKHLEEILNAPLKVLTTGLSLQGLIRKYNALPNWRQRWCTRELKIEVFNSYLMENRPAVSYVGLRADEPASVRRGTVLGGVEGITQRYPLREWGWGIDEVVSFNAQRGIIIPERTDCAWCFFQTLAEWWNLWAYHLDSYLEAEAWEERTGHTFRSPQRDTQPASLRGLREKFERGYVPRGAGQLALMDTRETMCRACSL